MIFFSHVLGKPVRNIGGERLGKVADVLVARADGTPGSPIVSHLVISAGGDKRPVTWEQVTSFEETGCLVRASLDQLPGALPDGISLRHDLLDKQIVDTDGRRVVRVNDVQLTRVGETLRVAGVDVSTRGLLRRLGCELWGERVARLFKRSLVQSVIPWEFVDNLDPRASAQIRLTISRQKLMDLHPADLAEILTDLHGAQRETLFQALDDETAAETLQELEEDVQLSLFKSLSDEKASSVLEEMDPDEAADLIAELPPERVAELLSRMEAEDAAEVQELMSYPPDSAGGIMTTEYIGLPSTLTAQQTIDRLRELAPDAETIYYLYIIDEAERLCGVLSLRDLIVSPPDTPITTFMRTNVIGVQVNDSVDEVRETMSKYDLLAIPVVDEHNVLRGIITVDDIMDRIAPTSWKRRFPRIL